MQAVSHSYGRSGGAGQVLENVDLTLNEDEIVGLLGRSGSGKSTLLRSIAGLIRPSEGRGAAAARWLGQGAQCRDGVPDLPLFPWLTVLQNVELGLEAQRVPPVERRTRAPARSI